MAALHVERVKRGDWRMRKSVRIEQEIETEDGEFSLADRLPASAESDPLIALLLNEAALDSAEKLAESYSQATAYAIALGNFQYDRARLCAHLLLSNDALLARFRAAAKIKLAQDSVFDRVERIPADFMPKPSKQLQQPQVDQREAKQAAWHFD